MSKRPDAWWVIIYIKVPADMDNIKYSNEYIMFCLEKKYK